MSPNLGAPQPCGPSPKETLLLNPCAPASPSSKHLVVGNLASLPSSNTSLLVSIRLVNATHHRLVLRQNRTRLQLVLTRRARVCVPEN